MENVIQNELRDKYGETNDFVTKTRFSKSEGDLKTERLLISYITSFYTSAHSKGKDPTSTSVRQLISNLKARLNKVSIISSEF